MPPKRQKKSGNKKARKVSTQRASRKVLAPPVSMIAEHRVSRSPPSFGRAPPTNRFPEGGVRLAITTSLPWFVGIPLASLQTINGPLTSYMPTAVSLTSGLNGIPVDLSFAGLLNDSTGGFISGNSLGSGGYGMFPVGLRNVAYQFTHGIVRKLRISAETEQSTAKDGQLAIGFIRDPVSVVTSSVGQTLAGYNTTKYVSNLPGSVVIPVWESASVDCINEKETRDNEPLPLGGGMLWDNKTSGALPTPPGQFVLRELTQGMFVAQYDAKTTGASNGDITHTLWADAVIDLYGAGWNITQPIYSADPTFEATLKLRDELADIRRELKIEPRAERKEVFATPRNSPRSRAAAMNLDGGDMVLVSKAELAVAKAAPPPEKSGIVRVDAATGWFGRS